MTPEQSFVDVALRNWRSNMDRAGKFFGALTPEELELQVAPTRNRLIYIWGHLTAINDSTLPLFGFGPRRYPLLEKMFITHPDRAVAHILSGPELNELWKELDFLLWAEFQRLTPSEWLQRHLGISPEDFVREPHRSRYGSLLGRTAHLAYHFGQAMLAHQK
jgi:hypothetical protein